MNTSFRYVLCFWQGCGDNPADYTRSRVQRAAVLDIAGALLRELGGVCWCVCAGAGQQRERWQEPCTKLPW